MADSRSNREAKNESSYNSPKMFYNLFWIPLNFFRFFKPIDLEISEVKN